MKNFTFILMVLNPCFLILTGLSQEQVALSSGLVILKEPSDFKDRLDSVISQVEAGCPMYQSIGEAPKSVYEAAEFVERSIHKIGSLKQGIEYRGCYIFSNALPKDFKDPFIIGVPKGSDAPSPFTSGYVVKKGEKIIYVFSLYPSKINVTYSVSPSKVDLKWPASTNAKGYRIYREGAPVKIGLGIPTDGPRGYGTMRGWDLIGKAPGDSTSWSDDLAAGFKKGEIRVYKIECFLFQPVVTQTYSNGLVKVIDYTIQEEVKVELVTDGK